MGNWSLGNLALSAQQKRCKHKVSKVPERISVYNQVKMFAK